MNYINEAGDYLARIISKGLITTDKSSALAIACEFEAHYRWRESAWEKIEPRSCSGRFWIIGKDGEILREAVERFVQATGWSGNLNTVKSEEFQECRITVGVEPYNGKDYYRVQWVNPFDSVPPGVMVDNTNDDMVAILTKKYGSVLRKISDHTDKPKKKEGDKKEDDDIPF